MAKLTASLTRKWSAMVVPDVWETAEASFSIEDDIGEVSDDDKKPYWTYAEERATAARAFVKAEVDAEMGRQREEIREQYGLSSIPPSYEDQSVAEAFGAEVGGDVEFVVPENTYPGQAQAEEPPPLPGGFVEPTGHESVEETFKGPQIVRTPLEDNQATFKVRWLEVAETVNGDKYLKCYGDSPKWKKKWVPAWSDVAELLFGDIEDMDTGELQPPYSLEATVMMKDDTYKGKTFRTADKVVEWTRVG